MDVSTSQPRCQSSVHLPCSHHDCGKTQLHFTLWQTLAFGPVRGAGLPWLRRHGYAAGTPKPEPAPSSTSDLACVGLPGSNRALAAQTQPQVPSRALCYCSNTSSQEPNALEPSEPSTARISASQAPARINLPHEDYSTSHPSNRATPATQPWVRGRARLTSEPPSRAMLLFL